MRLRFSGKVAVMVLVSMMLISGVFGCGEEAEEPTTHITLGSSTFSEPWVLTEMASILIEEKTDIAVEHTSGFTAEGLMHEALMEEDLHGYTSWTGTIFTTLFDMEVTQEWRDREKVLNYVSEEYEKIGGTVMPPFGFNNTYALAVREEFAQEHDLKTVSDLKEQSGDLVLACDYDFTERDGDGLTELLEHYDMEFKETEPMDYGMVYRAVGEGDVDVSVAYSTDGRIEAQNLVVLEDDKGFFPPYDGIFIMDQELLDDHPEIEEALEVLWGEIDEETMADLNAQIDVHERDYEDVAREFLQEQGLLDD